MNDEKLNNLLPKEKANLTRKFHALVASWNKETAFLSSVTEMAIHPAYQQIIGMGKDAIPLILKELEKNPNHWFWALKAIAGEDPVNPEDRGKIAKMAEAWLKWGKENGYKMTKTDLVGAVAARAGLSKKAVEEVLREAFSEIKKGLKRERELAYPDFGHFTVGKKKARIARNPKNGATRPGPKRKPAIGKKSAERNGASRAD